ncbi:hypothetical protein [Nocardia brasiliensis]|uniref:hypothetical protein n=1 Tax=Nocardia brasiliensis TaxID=37326 RepID=UPI001895AE26|nr:hypothetical protein [Nocardia brasiliensis]MBF6128772.1 hypothetical protein [Nocardia brasiliensis]
MLTRRSALGTVTAIAVILTVYTSATTAFAEPGAAPHASPVAEQKITDKEFIAFHSARTRLVAERALAMSKFAEDEDGQESTKLDVQDFIEKAEKADTAREAAEAAYSVAILATNATTSATTKVEEQGPEDKKSAATTAGRVAEIFTPNQLQAVKHPEDADIANELVLQEVEMTWFCHEAFGVPEVIQIPLLAGAKYPKIPRPREDRW